MQTNPTFVDAQKCTYVSTMTNSLSAKKVSIVGHFSKCMWYEFYRSTAKLELFIIDNEFFLYFVGVASSTARAINRLNHRQHAQAGMSARIHNRRRVQKNETTLLDNNEQCLTNAEYEWTSQKNKIGTSEEAL